MPSSCLHWAEMAAFGSQFPKTHRPPAAKDGGVSSNCHPTSPPAERPLPATATHTPPQNSPLPANRIRNGLQTDYRRTCCHWASWAAVSRGLMTGIDAPPPDRARPFRCHGYVESLSQTFGASCSFAEALDSVRPGRESLANSQSQVLVWPPVTAGGTVCDLQPLDRDSARNALKYVAGNLHPEGYHVPAVRHRDAFYQKLEDERAAAIGK